MMQKAIIQGAKSQRIKAYMMFMSHLNLSEAISQKEMLSLRLQIFQKDFKYAEHSLLVLLYYIAAFYTCSNN